MFYVWDIPWPLMAYIEMASETSKGHIMSNYGSQASRMIMRTPVKPKKKLTNKTGKNNWKFFH